MVVSGSESSHRSNAAVDQSNPTALTVTDAPSTMADKDAATVVSNIIPRVVPVAQTLLPRRIIETMMTTARMKTMRPTLMYMRSFRNLSRCA